MEIRRKVKNVVYKYSEAERYVREATSNDPWGPSTTMMSHIADMTHNQYAFESIMQLIWKRLNDKGKNWRHVYKSLVLLEYLVKCGDDRVATECLQNIHTIQTLKDFQYFEEHKDLGVGIREKSKILVTLLKDKELLEMEKEKGKNVKAKFHKPNSALGSHQLKRPGELGREIRKQYQKEQRHSKPVMQLNFEERGGDEDYELQRAIELSKQEHELAEKKRLEDEAKEELKLKMVLEQSKKEEEVLSSLRPPPKQRKDSRNSDKIDSERSSNKDINKLREASSIFEALHGSIEKNNENTNKKSTSNNIDDPWGEQYDVEPINNGHNNNNSKKDAPLGLDFDPWAGNNSTNATITATPISMKYETQNKNSFSELDKDPWGTNNLYFEKPQTTYVGRNSIVDRIFGDEKPNTQFATHVNFDSTIDGGRKFSTSSYDYDEVGGGDVGATNASDPWAITGPSSSIIEPKIKEPRNVNTGSLASLTDLGDYEPEEKMTHSLSVMDLSQKKKLTPQEFLGENANLVNFDNLLPAPKAGNKNPFGGTSNSGVISVFDQPNPQLSTHSNPFNSNIASVSHPRIPMNQMAPTNQFGMAPPISSTGASYGLVNQTSPQFGQPMNAMGYNVGYTMNMNVMTPYQQQQQQQFNNIPQSQHMPVIMSTSKSSISNNHNTPWMSTNTNNTNNNKSSLLDDSFF